MINILDILKKDQQLFIVEKDNQSIKELTIYQDHLNLDFSITCKIDYSGKTMNIFEVQKDKEYLIGKYADLEFGQLALFVVVNSYFHQVKPFDSIKRMLRNISDATKAENIIEEQVGKHYFSLFKTETGKINLEKIKDDCFNIIYLSLQSKRIKTATKKSISAAFVVVYNYGFYLKEFDDLIKDIISLSNLNLKQEEIEELKKLYLKK